MRRILVMVALAGGLVGACIGGEGPAGTTPTDCKKQCNALKSSSCYSAAQFNDCYGSCGAAVGSEIETFINCAENSTCDPDCAISTAASVEAVDTAGCESGCDTWGNDCPSVGTDRVDVCKAACRSDILGWVTVDCLALRGDSCDFDPNCAPPVDLASLAELESSQECGDKCAELAEADCLPAQPNACFGACDGAGAFARPAFLSCATKAIASGSCSNDEGASHCVTGLIGGAKN